MKTDTQTLKTANWDELEHDVLVRLRLLQLAAKSIENGEIHDKIANDLILPNLQLLASFVANFDVGQREYGVLKHAPSLAKIAALESLRKLAAELDIEMDGERCTETQAALLNGIRSTLDRIDDIELEEGIR